MLELTAHALDIWKSAVDAVSSSQLVKNVLQRQGDELTVCGNRFRLSDLQRIVVVGTGKAGAGMASAVEEVLGADVVDAKVIGWVNVPADCARELRRIRLHAARPAGVNEPTVEGVGGSLKILQLVERLRDDDLCLVLLSGGGSALLPAPCFGVSLDDKQEVTRLLSRGGATINELNTVRKQLSLIKGGGLARALKAGRMIGLIISDVIGDPLDIISSGPTVDDDSTPAMAFDILKRIVGLNNTPKAVLELLNEKIALEASSAGNTRPRIDPDRVQNYVIGNNAVAVAAAEQQARSLGYDVRVIGVGIGGIASEIGRDLARQCLAARAEVVASGKPLCLISGGEPTVRLSETKLPRKGGRNQELVLAACVEILNAGSISQSSAGGKITILSGGTDGEDGPTDAAGAWLDADVLQSIQDQHLVPEDYLAINNAYEFFSRAGGLLKSGPTHTNVMDVRVALISP